MVSARGAGRMVQALAWGVLFPAKGVLRLSLLINARAETLGAQLGLAPGAGRVALLDPRWDGFYEWQGEGDARQPWHIAREDGAPSRSPGCGSRRSETDAGVRARS